MTKIDQVIKDMELYGDDSESRKEVIEKIFQSTGTRYPMYLIANANNILRKTFTVDKTKYGWTWQYVKGGANTIGDKRWKIYRLGAAKYIPSIIELQSSEDGIFHIIYGHVTEWENIISQLTLKLNTHIISQNNRDYYEELIDRLELNIKSFNRWAATGGRPRKAASGGGSGSRSNGSDPISEPLDY